MAEGWDDVQPAWHAGGHRSVLQFALLSCRNARATVMIRVASIALPQLHQDPFGIKAFVRLQLGSLERL